MHVNPIMRFVTHKEGNKTYHVSAYTYKIHAMDLMIPQHSMKIPELRS